MKKVLTIGKLFLLIVIVVITGCVSLDTIKKLEEAVDINIDLAKKTAQNDPTSPAGKYLPKLEKIKQELKKHQSGEISLSIEDLQKRNDETMKIAIGMELSKEIIEETFFFGSGKHELNEQGKNKIDEFVTNKVAKKINDLGEKLHILLEVIGYSDAISPKESLKIYLQQSLNNLHVSREVLNQELSRLRAQSLGEYSKQQLKKLPNVEEVEIEKVEGRGEKLPFDEMNPPYQLEDERRRICKLYIKFE